MSMMPTKEDELESLRLRAEMAEQQCETYRQILGGLPEAVAKTVAAKALADSLIGQNTPEMGAAVGAYSEAYRVQQEELYAIVARLQGRPV